ncbi:histidine kinase [Nonlabens ulvanivorans]|uniref:tetratricopeptide repeat-containing sensor histidine kinase n=1 Tax=Nonlabens ulvanivorans TaxID=906888 RepID=UPI0037C99C65
MNIEENNLSTNSKTSISEKYFNSGLQYYKENNLEKAKELYKKAIDSCLSTDANLQFKYYTKLMGIYIFKNEYGDALAVLREFEQKELFPIEQKFILVKNTEQYIYLNSGQLDKALESNQEYYDLILQNASENELATALILKSTILRKKNEFKESSLILQDLLKYNDLHPLLKSSIFTSLGITYFYNNDYNRSIDAYKKSLKFHKTSELDGRVNGLATSYANISEAFIALDDYEKARKYLDSFYMLNQAKVSNNLRVSIYKYELRLARKLNLDNSKIEQLIDKSSNELELFYQNRFSKELESLKKEKVKSQDLLIEKQNVELDNFKFLIALIISVSFIIIISLSLFFYLRKKRKDYEIESLLKQQRLLRAQMNPHFVFNSLSRVKEMISNNKELAFLYLNKFSRLLRLVLENSANNFVLLDDELDAVENYLDLQKLRYPHKFDYEIILKDLCQDSLYYIPPMLLQPFLENAIEHGFQNLEFKGLISLELSLSKKPNYLRCVIIDNGIGIQKVLDTSKRISSISLISNYIIKATKENIQYRSNKNNKGTIVDFLIPIQQ